MSIHEEFFQVLEKYVKSDEFSLLDTSSRSELSRCYMRMVAAKELPEPTEEELNLSHPDMDELIRMDMALNYKDRLPDNFKTYPSGAMLMRLQGVFAKE